MSSQRDKNALEHNPFPPFSRIFVVCGRDCNLDLLRRLFSTYGDIHDMHIALDRTKKSRGFAFIQFTKTSSAALAIEELNGHTMETGHNLKVMIAQNRTSGSTEREKSKKTSNSSLNTVRSDEMIQSSGKRQRDHPPQLTRDKKRGSTSCYSETGGQEESPETPRRSIDSNITVAVELDGSIPSSSLQKRCLSPNANVSEENPRSRKQSAKDERIADSHSIVKPCGNKRHCNNEHIAAEGENKSDSSDQCDHTDMPKEAILKESSSVMRRPIAAKSTPMSEDHAKVTTYNAEKHTSLTSERRENGKTSTNTSFSSGDISIGKRSGEKNGKTESNNHIDDENPMPYQQNISDTPSSSDEKLNASSDHDPTDQERLKKSPIKNSNRKQSLGYNALPTKPVPISLRNINFGNAKSNSISYNRNTPPRSCLFFTSINAYTHQELEAMFQVYGNFEYIEMKNPLGRIKTMAYIKYSKASTAAVVMESCLGQEETDFLENVQITYAEGESGTSNDLNNQEFLFPQKQRTIRKRHSARYSRRNTYGYRVNHTTCTPLDHHLNLRTSISGYDDSRFEQSSGLESYYYSSKIQGYDPNSMSSKTIIPSKQIKPIYYSVTSPSSNKDSPSTQSNTNEANAEVFDNYSQDSSVDSTEKNTDQIVNNEDESYVESGVSGTVESCRTDYRSSISSNDEYEDKESGSWVFAVCDRYLTIDDLSGIFSSCPGMELIDLKVDKYTRISKGYAYVKFNNDESAAAAIELFESSEYDFGSNIRLRVMWPDTTEAISIRNLNRECPRPLRTPHSNKEDEDITVVQNRFAHMMSSDYHIGNSHVSCSDSFSPYARSYCYGPPSYPYYPMIYHPHSQYPIPYEVDNESGYANDSDILYSSVESNEYYNYPHFMNAHIGPYPSTPTRRRQSVPVHKSRSPSTPNRRRFSGKESLEETFDILSGDCLIVKSRKKFPSESAIRNAFLRYGIIVNFRYELERKRAYIKFSSVQEAKTAFEKMHLSKIEEQEICVYIVLGEPSETRKRPRMDKEGEKSPSEGAPEITKCEVLQDVSAQAGCSPSSEKTIPTS